MSCLDSLDIIFFVAMENKIMNLFIVLKISQQRDF